MVAAVSGTIPLRRDVLYRQGGAGWGGVVQRQRNVRGCTACEGGEGGPVRYGPGDPTSAARRGPFHPHFELILYWVVSSIFVSHMTHFPSLNAQPVCHRVRKDGD